MNDEIISCLTRIAIQLEKLNENIEKNNVKLGYVDEMLNELVAEIDKHRHEVFRNTLKESVWREVLKKNDCKADLHK
jgi:hypothetical protein